MFIRALLWQLDRGTEPDDIPATDVVHAHGAPSRQLWLEDDPYAHRTLAPAARVFYCARDGPLTAGARQRRKRDGTELPVHLRERD